MNRAERERQQKLAKKAASNAKLGKATFRSPGQQTQAIQESIDLAVQHHNEGRLPEAESIYQQILQTDPNQPVALNLLGAIAHQVGNHDTAVDLITKALTIQPDYAGAHGNLGNAFKELGKLDEAVASYQKALAIEPDNAGAHSNLGAVLQELGRLDEAVASCNKALAIKPDLAEAHSNLGNAFKKLGRLDDAEASYHKALSIRSDYTEAYSNLGALYNEWGKHEDAAASCRKALTINPDFAEAHGNLGGALQKLGKFDEAAASCRKALTIKPDYAEAHSNLGIISLLMGDFETGWPEYSWRQFEDDSVLKIRAYPQPFWDGEDLTGKTIFVYPEQGLGDIIQFVRYLPMVRKRGGYVAFDVPPSMMRLFRDLDGIDIALKHGDLLPPFDCHIPLLEFPRLFGTTLDTIPASAAYLHADEELTDAWAERLGPRQGFRIGLVWGGNPGHLNDHNRSTDPELFRPLIETPGVEAFSLMVGRDGEAARVFGDGLSDLAPHLGDFADTAAAIAHLDLVISVDTAPAHLAGALGAPVWTLLPFNPDWRWMLDRDDSPWYPSMRLFRQETPGDWEGVFQEVETALRNEI